MKEGVGNKDPVLVTEVTVNEKSGGPVLAGIKWGTH